MDFERVLNLGVEKEIINEIIGMEYEEKEDVDEDFQMGLTM